MNASPGGAAAPLEGCCGRYNTEFGVPPCNCTGWEVGTNTAEFAWCAIMLLGACISVCLHSLQSKREKSQVDETLAEFAAIRSFREYELKVREEQLKKQSQSQLLDTLGNFFVAAAPKTRVVRPTSVLQEDFFDLSPRESVAVPSSAPQSATEATKNDALSRDVQSTVEKLRSIRRIATHQAEPLSVAKPNVFAASTALGRQQRAASKDSSSHGLEFDGPESNRVISRMQSTLRTLRSIQRSATAQLSDDISDSGSGADEEGSTAGRPPARGGAHYGGGGQTFTEYLEEMQDSTDDDERADHGLSAEHADHAEAELAASLAAADPEPCAVEKEQSANIIVGPHGGIISTPRHALSDIAEFPEVTREDEEDDYDDSGSPSPRSPKGFRR
eukprot:INCI7889.1.p1 GENE.INCI7889.1~~INCI7889.1.p1  ORF type:complete len:388 (+),score=56.21 INCI7889.1:193-1356(+)